MILLSRKKQTELAQNVRLRKTREQKTGKEEIVEQRLHRLKVYDR